MHGLQPVVGYDPRKLQGTKSSGTSDPPVVTHRPCWTCHVVRNCNDGVHGAVVLWDLRMNVSESKPTNKPQWSIWTHKWKVCFECFSEAYIFLCLKTRIGNLVRFPIWPSYIQRTSHLVVAPQDADGTVMPHSNQLKAEPVYHALTERGWKRSLRLLSLNFLYWINMWPLKLCERLSMVPIF